MTETPTAAFVLSLIGGIFILIGGLAVVGIGMLLGALGGLGSVNGLSSLSGLGNLSSISGSTGGAGAPITALGGVGVLLGIAAVAVAVMMHLRSGRHRLWGALMLGFSAVSWVTSLGGLLIGFLLALIGGVLAISWKPSAGPSASPPQITRVCPACGTVLQRDTKFCPNCGRAFL